MPFFVITKENYEQGFMMDEECLGGISQSRENPHIFECFVVRHSTGEFLGYQEFTSLEEALLTINSVKRDWIFQSSSGCGLQNCKKREAGGCGSGCTKHPHHLGAQSFC